jgi:hypothetical protein
MTFGTLWRRVRLFIDRDSATADLQDEMRLHLQMRAEMLERGGMGASDASAQARRQFGNRTMIVEEARDVSGLRWLEHALHDLRFAFRG